MYEAKSYTLAIAATKAVLQKGLWFMPGMMFLRNERYSKNRLEFSYSCPYDWHVGWKNSQNGEWQRYDEINFNDYRLSLGDYATVGCLLQLIREAKGDPTWRPYPLHLGPEELVWLRDQPSQINQTYYESEIEAMVYELKYIKPTKG